MTTAAVHLDGIHALALEVDATRRLVAVADQLVAELVERERRIRDWVDDLNGDDPGAGSPTRLDRIMDLSQAHAVTTDLLWVADRICRAVDNDPPSVGAAYAKIMLDDLLEIRALQAELVAARGG